MRWLFSFVGITSGAFGGGVGGGLVGWLVVRLLAGHSALSNPDLPGGMAWLVVFVLAAIGFFVGGAYGVRLGQRLFLEWGSESRNPDDADR